MNLYVFLLTSKLTILICKYNTRLLLWASIAVRLCIYTKEGYCVQAERETKKKAQMGFAAAPVTPTG